MSSAQNDSFLAGADVQPRELDDVLRLRGCVLLRCVAFSACCCGSGCRSAGCCGGGGLSTQIRETNDMRFCSNATNLLSSFSYRDSQLNSEPLRL